MRRWCECVQFGRASIVYREHYEQTGTNTSFRVSSECVALPARVLGGGAGCFTDGVEFGAVVVAAVEKLVAHPRAQRRLTLLRLRGGHLAHQRLVVKPVG